ncbi:MAG: DUF4493 domain-containing protein [Rikenellaceae bacterium]
MKRKGLILTIVGAVLMMGSCNRSSDLGAVDESMCGTTSFNCSTQSIVVEMTRAESSYTIPADKVPSVDDLTVVIGGRYIDSTTQEESTYSYGPLLVSEYNEALPKMVASSDYSASFYYGEAEAEGEDACYFAGSIDFEVVARGATNEEVTVTLQNSIISMTNDEMFSNYYTDAVFTVKSSSGNSFVFSLPSEKIVFVEAGTTLTLSGVANKVSSGESVTFNATEIGQTTARTMSRINVEANSGVGGENISITLDDTITEMEEITVELNTDNR